MKIYKDTNVLKEAINRTRIAFEEFDNIYFSVSGGKDSSVMIHIAEMVASEMGKTYDVLYIDLEAQYKGTIEHVEELTHLRHIRNFYWVALPMQLRNAVSVLQPKWICWSPTQESIWVREMPKYAIHIGNHEFDFYQLGMEFEEFITGFADWYQRQHGGIVGAGIGIRSDESLNRFRTIASTTKTTLKDYQWTTLLKPYENVYNFYTIYDWRTEDVWGFVSKYNVNMNQIYEAMYKNGLSIHEQRLCQPYGDDQKNGLDQFKSIEYETWEKVLNRVNGVNFGNIYARTSALGNIKSTKPDHMTWQEYSVFLLESLGIYNKELMFHYVGKIDKHIKWWEKNHGCGIHDIPDEADLKLESLKKVPSWRRIARAIERNDFYMKRLGFSQNKTDEDLLRIMISKYDNLFDVKNTTDTHLKRFFEKESNNEEKD